MGFRKDAYASVWDVEEGRGNTLKVRLSTSRKNKDGEYEQDFSGFCTFIGNAKTKAEKLRPKDRIRLGDVDVTSWYSKEKGIEYITYKVFDIEVIGSPAKKSPEPEDTDGDVSEDNLPF